MGGATQVIKEKIETVKSLLHNRIQLFCDDCANDSASRKMINFKWYYSVLHTQTMMIRLIPLSILDYMKIWYFHYPSGKQPHVRRWAKQSNNQNPTQTSQHRNEKPKSKSGRKLFAFFISTNMCWYSLTMCSGCRHAVVFNFEYLWKRQRS